jgi:hypothetical protein
VIGDVVLKPGPMRGQVEAELRGELMGILDFTGSHQKIDVLAKLGQTCPQAIAQVAKQRGRV